jgi:hypothetical protein
MRFRNLIEWLPIPPLRPRAPMKASDIKTLVRHHLWIEKRSYDVAEDVVVRCGKEESRKRRN